jgi:hypothetical protein
MLSVVLRVLLPFSSRPVHGAFQVSTERVKINMGQPSLISSTPQQQTYKLRLRLHCHCTCHLIMYRVVFRSDVTKHLSIPFWNAIFRQNLFRKKYCYIYHLHSVMCDILFVFFFPLPCKFFDFFFAYFLKYISQVNEPLFNLYSHFLHIQMTIEQLNTMIL